MAIIHHVERLLAAPQISRRITVSGHVYDTDTGLVTAIVEPASPSETLFSPGALAPH